MRTAQAWTLEKEEKQKKNNPETEIGRSCVV